MSPNLISQLMRDEGTILHAYKDSEGYWTIGSGICIDALMGCGITASENQYLLGNRVMLATQEILDEWPWASTLDTVRFGAMVNMAFNMGIKRLAGFVKFLAYMENEEWPQAAAEMLDSVWAKQVGARSERLAKQVILGTWQ